MNLNATRILLFHAVDLRDYMSKIEQKDDATLDFLLIFDDFIVSILKILSALYLTQILENSLKKNGDGDNNFSDTFCEISSAIAFCMSLMAPSNKIYQPSNSTERANRP